MHGGMEPTPRGSGPPYTVTIGKTEADRRLGVMERKKQHVPEARLPPDHRPRPVGVVDTDDGVGRPDADASLDGVTIGDDDPHAGGTRG